MGGGRGGNRYLKWQSKAQGAKVATRREGNT